MMKTFPLYLLLTTALLSGCSLVPDYTLPELPAAPWRSTQDTKQEPVADAEISPDWWNRFGNQELPVLVKDALASNNDMNAALARIEQARANAQIAGASLWPTASLSAGAGSSFNQPGYRAGQGIGQSRGSYNAGGTIGYEADIFGRNRAGVGAALSALHSTEYDKEALALVVESDTAQAFIGILALDDRIAVARNNLANAQDVLRITQQRYEAGTLSALEPAQQRTALANSESAIASLIQQREVLIDQLALLSGKAPQDFTVQSKGLAGFILPDIAPLQPSQLLTRRPDIQSAEAQLATANYNIGAARAAFYPNFQLSASSAISASPLSAAAALTSALAAAIAQPVFTGGVLEGQLAFSKARRTELEEQYKKVVLTSFQEVQDALANQQRAREQVKQLSIAASQAQKAYNLVRQRFDVGTVDFLTLLDAQRSLFSTQDNLIAAKQDQLTTAIILFKTLGGGWQNNADTSK